MRIYEAEANDTLYARMISLSAGWEAEDSCHGYRTNTEDDLRGRRIFVAEEDGEIVGYLFGLSAKAKEESSVIEKDAAYFEIEELYVIPARRSEGIGRGLFALCEAAARRAGLRQIMLSTATKDWKRVLHFYLDELGMEFWNARLFKRLEN